MPFTSSRSAIALLTIVGNSCVILAIFCRNMKGSKREDKLLFHGEPETNSIAWQATRLMLKEEEFGITLPRFVSSLSGD